MLAACAPGGVIMPAQIPHYDRPAISGVLLNDDGPAVGRSIKAIAFVDQGPKDCSSKGATTRTDENGRFEIVEDRDWITAWWGQGGYHVVALCVLDAPNLAMWLTILERSSTPPFLPARIVVTRRLDAEDKPTCVRDYDAENDVSA